MGRFRTLFISFVLVSSLSGYVQAQTLRESQFPKEVQSALATTSTDTAKVNVLLDIATKTYQSDPASALAYCFYALQLARGASSETHIDQALLKIGKLLFHNGAFEEAMNYYNDYYQRALKSDNILNQLKSRHNIIALKLTVSNKYDEKIYREMQTLLKDYDALWLKSGDSVIIKEMIPGLLINISHVASLGGLLDQAESYLNQGFEINNKYGLPDQSILQLYLSDVVLKSKTGKFLEAIEQGNYAQELCKKSGNLMMLATLDYYLGNVWAEKGELEEATKHYMDAFHGADKLQNHSVRAESANKLYEVYQKTGNLAASIKFNKAAQESRESMKKLEANAKIAQAEMLEQMQLLEKDIELERQAETRRNVLIAGLLLALAIGGVILFWQTRKKYRQANQEKEVYETEVKKTTHEKELLESELEIKDKQLATETMFRIQKNEIIREVVQKLTIAQRQQKKELHKELSEAIKGLESAMDNASWDDFEHRFLQVHQGFYEKLEQQYPKLTNNERRLCAFLKLGMNSKEIATLTGQSLKSIDMSRYRLRKKLGIQDQELAFADFFANI